MPDRRPLDHWLHPAAGLAFPDRPPLGPGELAALVAEAGRFLTRHGLRPGDRFALHGPPRERWVALLLAALEEGVTAVPVPPTADPRAAVRFVRGRGVALMRSDGTVAWEASGDADPPSISELALLLRTSGTAGVGKWFGLTAENVQAVLASHAGVFDGPATRVWAGLPWHHCFGLVLELLLGLRVGATLIRDGSAGRDPTAALAGMTAARATHAHAVPLMAERWLTLPDGHATVATLAGGIVGGAPIRAPLAAALIGTRLRVGYGQTEASPGISLGEPGEWTPYGLGRPLGCKVRCASDGVLEFDGPNACNGSWTADGYIPVSPGWRSTGDCVEIRPDRLIFRGRADGVLKLASGSALPADRYEVELQQQYPWLVECLLWSPDGIRLAVAYAATGRRLTTARVRRTCPAIAHRIASVSHVAGQHWLRTAKGTTDRPAMEQWLAGGRADL